MRFASTPGASDSTAIDGTDSCHQGRTATRDINVCASTLCESGMSRSSPAGHADRRFPPDVIVTGTRVAIQKQLGNAVPSLLAEVLGREVANQFFGIPFEGQCSLLVQPRRPIPPPEPTRPVPEKYLQLQGEHAEHPGTGKGYAAARRPRIDECHGPLPENSL
jgi:hypothetical protein